MTVLFFVIVWIVTIIFWGSVIYGIWAVNFQKNTEKKKIGQGILNIAAFFFIIVIVGSVIGGVFEKGSNFFGKNSDAKEYCGKSSGVLNAKTDTAAKLAYKSCLKSY